MPAAWVDEFAQRRRKPLVASGGPWNRYDFPKAGGLANELFVW